MKLLDNYRLELGEGPGYDPEYDMAWWFDITQRKIFTRQIGGGETICHDLPLAASAMGITREGRQLLLTEKGLYFRHDISGTLSLHVALEADNPVTRSNDARVHPSGAFWISTMGWNGEPGAGSIYYYRAGTIERLWGDLSVPNAICFSPDGTRGYFTDTVSGQVMHVGLDAISGRPVTVPEIFISDPGGVPDGAITDRAGNIWLALFGAGKIVGFSPQGKKIGEILLPTSQVTCPAFVGTKAAHMLITTAFHGLSGSERSASPDAGAVFLTPIDFVGRFDSRIAT